MAAPVHGDNSGFASDLLRPRMAVGFSELPFTGTLLYLYVLAVVLLSAYPGLSLAATAIGLTLAFVFAIEVVGRRNKLYFPAPIIAFAVFLCFCSFQMLWATGSSTALFTLFQLLILTIIVVNYCLISGGDRLVEFAIYSAVLASLFYIILFGPELIDGRVASTVGNANEYSSILLVGLLLILRRLLSTLMERPISYCKTLIAALYLALSVYAIVYLTGSRMGILLAVGAVALVLLYWVWQQPVRRRVWVTVAVLGVCVSVGYAVYQSPHFSRLAPLASYFQGETVKDTSILARDQMRKDGISLWLERPIAGWGLDQYRVVSGWGTYAHDNYAELLTNQGLIGLMLYLLVYVSALVSLLRAFRRSEYPEVAARAFWGIAVLIVIAAGDFVSVRYYNKFHWLTLGVVIALAARGGRDYSHPSPTRAGSS